MVITGTSSGIGKYLAEYYVSKGYQVIGCSRRETSIENENYTHFLLDVSIEKDVKAMINHVMRNFKRIDILINNAGFASTNHLLLFPTKTAENIVNTNFIGTFLFCREAAKAMVKKNWGRIVNVVSVDTPLKLEGTAVYAASKAAIVNFTEVIARELASYNITVNTVGPSPVKTGLIRGIPEEKFSHMINRQAIKRYCEFRDISNVIDFYISEGSDFVTGQNIYLGGV
ncbi:MAG: SDR family oxidoreductase [Bacteroidetes bacterium]|nr:SDR family oxidoreductase [Bacteroidota bacterium]